MQTKDLFGYLRVGIRAVIVHPIQLAWRGSPGVERFRDNFLPEGLVPTGPEDRVHLREASRCIGCGLCDAPASAAGLGQLPSLVPLVFSRSSVEISQYREAISQLLANEPLLIAGERLCPTRVPLLGLTLWLADRLARVDAAEAGHP